MNAGGDGGVSVVIVNWNAGAMLCQCLNSVQQALVFCGGASEVIVVDNASSDGSAKGLTCPGVDLRIIENAENRGFGAACNQGAEIARGEYLLFLNPDAVLESDSIEGALRAICSTEHGNIGVCGVQLKDETGRVARSCARQPTVWHFVASSLGLDRIFPAASYAMRDWAHDATRVVDHVIGAFYLLRRDVFNAVGGFDERFFVYLEDLDLSVRLKAAGYLSLYFSEVQAVHKGGGTSERIKAKRLFYSLRSRIQYVFKHFSPLGVWCVLASTILIEPLTRLGHCALRGAWEDAGHTLEAYGMLIRALPDVLRGNRGG